MNLKKTYELMSRYYNKGKKEVPKYKIADLIFLNSKGLTMKQTTKNFDHKMLGPLRISKVISRMVAKLQLPKLWTIRPIFHVKLLEPYQH
jgi:hypothetical protein